MGGISLKSALRSGYLNLAAAAVKMGPERRHSLLQFSAAL
jgi:hypothetical protein